MKNLTTLIFCAIITFVFNSCKEDVSSETTTASKTIMKMPMSTTNAESKELFLTGLYEFDMGHQDEANAVFEQALEIDSNFVMGRLLYAFSSNNFDDFNDRFIEAEALSGNASQSEKLMLQIIRSNMDNNVERSLELSKELVNTNPESPRAHLWHAGGLSGIKKYEEAREYMAKAIELAPEFVPAYVQAGNSYLFNDPKDYEKAEQFFQKVLELAPTEQRSYDFMGDVYRAKGDFEKSRDFYTKATEYSGDDGSPFQQRGHVNSFLGDFAAARADYDKALSMAKENERPGFAVYRALVNVYEGNPEMAIEELKNTVTQTKKDNWKQFPLTSAFWIAIHNKMFDTAEELHAEWVPIRMEQAKKGGTDAMMRDAFAAQTYREGMLTCMKGDYAGAAALADKLTTLVEPDADPRKMERVHHILGSIALEQGNFAEAVKHFDQANTDNIYIKYQLAKAHEGAGESKLAMQYYSDIAQNNFNSVPEALTRQIALEKIR